MPLSSVASGLRDATPMQRVTAERQGVSARLVKDLANEMAIPAIRLFKIIGVPKATAERKAEKNEAIAGGGGQAALGLLNLLGIAQAIVADSTDERAAKFDVAKWLGRWIENPQPALGGRKPADLLDYANRHRSSRPPARFAAEWRLPVKLWRIATETRSHAANDLSGTGAALRPGRWNQSGDRVVYCAESIALAALETTAYVDAGGLPLNRFVVEIEVPDAVWKSRQQLLPEQLDAGWSAVPAGLASIAVGSRWIAQGSSALLLVPSVIVPEECAVLVNPAHADAGKNRGDNPTALRLPDHLSTGSNAMTQITLVAFDADDTLWRSQEHFDDAQSQFESIMAPYIDLDRSDVSARLYATESRNIALFGYGAKGMTLSMIETAITLSNERISARDLHRIVELGKAVLQHPIELLPGIRAAVEKVAARHRIILVTKGDLFHQEAKVAQSGLSDLFTRIEIVSEKNSETYARVLRECEVAAENFVMVGNSMRSDIEPVVALGGYGIHMPYHTTWTHETIVATPCDPSRVREVVQPSEIAPALESFSR